MPSARPNGETFQPRNLILLARPRRRHGYPSWLAHGIEAPRSSVTALRGQRERVTAITSRAAASRLEEGGHAPGGSNLPDGLLGEADPNLSFKTE